MIRVKVTKGSKKSFRVKMEDLLNKSLLELVEEKLKSPVSEDKIKLNGDKVEVVTGEEKVVEIEEQELLKQSIEQAIKKRLNLKSLKGVELAIIGGVGKK